MSKKTIGNRNVSETATTDREDGEEMNIYANVEETNDVCRETEDTRRNQTPQHTGSECVRIRSPRSVLVCLVVLCVLLLTAVIVLCVLIYTNNHQFNINNKNITQEKDQLLTNNTKLTEERDQLNLKYINMIKENDALLSNNNNLSKEQLTQQINKLWRILNETDEWIYYQCSLYFISSERKSWSESRRDCRERGADLIIINNKEEQNFVEKYSNSENIWIGLSDSEVENTWKWVDGSTMNYRSWSTREPNGHRRENCALSYLLNWADFPCNEAFKWICERKINE